MEGLYTQGASGQDGKDISERRSGHSRMSADTCEFLWGQTKHPDPCHLFPAESAKYLIPCHKQFCKSALIGVYVDIDFWRDWGCFWPCLGFKAGKSCKTWSFWIQKYIWKLKFSFANLVPRKHPQIDGFINHFMIKFGRQKFGKRFWVYFPPGRLSRLLTSNRDEINNFAKTHWLPSIPLIWWKVPPCSVLWEIITIILKVCKRGI